MGIHCVHLGRTRGVWGGIQGARLEINVLDRKARAYVLWRVDKSDASRDESFVEYGLGFANLGELGGRNTALSWFVGGPSAYVAWGNTRRTLEWKRGRGKGTLPMTVHVGPAGGMVVHGPQRVHHNRRRWGCSCPCSPGSSCRWIEGPREGQS